MQDVLKRPGSSNHVVANTTMTFIEGCFSRSTEFCFVVGWQWGKGWKVFEGRVILFIF